MPSASGGYDITWSSSVGGVDKHTYTDHTDQDLSNVAVGLNMNYFEFLNSSSGDRYYGRAHMDNFSLDYEAAGSGGGVLPEPCSLIVWGLLGMVGLGVCGRRRSRRTN